MKKIIFGILILITLSSCCDTDGCQFAEGDDVIIKHKTTHNTAIITEVRCGCDYTINYYSHLGVRRHRVVTEGEISPYNPEDDDIHLDKKLMKTIIETL
jgi:hypothetical protein